MAASPSSYAAAATSPRTRDAYASASCGFARWCADQGATALPAAPPDVARYLADLARAGRKAATIDLHAAAIAAAHRDAGLASPTANPAVRAEIRGIRRTIGTRRVAKAPATAETIRKMLRRVPGDLAGLRDRAILLIGFAGALRRSELVALTVADVERLPEGVILHLRRSKTDQEGQGHAVPVPRGSKLRPVEALDAWLAAARIAEGPIFRPVGKGGAVGADALTGRSVATIIKDRAAAVGLDPSVFAGHSLRAGYITSALAAGADVLRVMDQSRHTQVDTLKVYDRRAKAFRDHSGARFL